MEAKMWKMEVRKWQNGSEKVEKVEKAQWKRPKVKLFLEVLCSVSSAGGVTVITNNLPKRV